MYQMINNLALGATLITLVAALWHDWSLVTAIKRMVIAYLCFFFFGAFMALAVKLVALLEKDPPESGRADGNEPSQGP